jgi:predicted DNA-binding antitoxin AbrB/MazE fold protein
MTKRIRAVYRDGALHPAEPLDLPDGTVVWLDITPLTPEERLEEATRLYEGLSDEEIAEIERIILDRSNFMRPPDRWLAELTEKEGEEGR